MNPQFLAIKDARPQVLAIRYAPQTYAGRPLGGSWLLPDGRVSLPHCLMMGTKIHVVEVTNLILQTLCL